MCVWKKILKSPKEFTSRRLNVQSAADMVSRMNDFKTAIGHTGSVWKFSPDDNVKSVKINGYTPNASNLANGNYPFYRMLSAVTSEEVSGDIPRLMQLTRELLQNSDVAADYSILPYSKSTAPMFAKAGDI